MFLKLRNKLGYESVVLDIKEVKVYENTEDDAQFVWGLHIQNKDQTFQTRPLTDIDYVWLCNSEGKTVDTLYRSF